MTLFFFILILVLLILVHEFGHFVVAKFFGIKVHEFGIFFPPRIFSKKFGETEYSLNWLPFGGFVKIFGENYDEGKDDPSRQGAAEADPRSFVNKSRWQQAAVILAGIVFNLLFAWLALTVGYMVGLPTSAEHRGFGLVQGATPTVIAVLPDSPAQK
ncbi:MAG: site-2 protease family protein, partial [bacterium]|nr:site-2 protease family protein [bacterium]